MKKAITCLVLIVFAVQADAQWNPEGDNKTTGNLRVGAHFTILPLGGSELMPELYIHMKQDIGYFGDIAFRYEDANKKAIIRSQYSETGACIHFITSPLAGGNKIRMTITGDGNIGIGTQAPTAKLDVNGSIKGNKLDVNGTIRSKEVKIEATGWADFVFDEDYRLPELSEVEKHIKTHKHLPDIPSEKQVAEEGIDVAGMQAKLLQKIEELTLYVIEQEKQNKNLQKQVKELEEKLNSIY